MTHSSDNRTGEGDGDDEAGSTINSKSPRLHPENRRHGHNLRCVCARTKLARCRTRSSVWWTNGLVPAAPLRSERDYSAETAIVFAEIYRHNGEWKFSAVVPSTADSRRFAAATAGLSDDSTPGSRQIIQGC
ncbi:MAG: TerD family protein [Merdibacter sp.]